MADPRSVMQEFRFLEQKRQAGGLTPAEATRHAELRDLVGFEQPPPVRGGFDVTAAAAQLRESLLPAGLRSRPTASPTPPPAPAAEPAWTPPEPAPGPAFQPETTVDPLFDPSTLGQDVRPQAWNPEAPGYDPDAPYDEAAWIAAGYDPTATYDWSSVGVADPSLGEEVPGDDGTAPAPQPDPSVELQPVEFGEYDAPGAPLGTGEPVEPLEPAPVPDDGVTWFDDAGAVPELLPEPEPPAFGEYDASPPVAAIDAGGEPFYGGPEGDSLPGGTPLELDGTPSSWVPEGALEGGFELASDGSFGGPEAPAQVAPWSSPAPAAAAERWESAPALDLSTPFAPTVIPAAPRPAAPQADGLEPLDGLDPEEALAPAFAQPLEALPSEPAWQPPAPDPAPAPPLPLEPADQPEPVNLSDLDTSIEIDVPPEVAAAYATASAPAPALDFDAPPTRAPVASTRLRAFEAAAAAPEAVVAAEPVVEPLVEPVSTGGTVVAGSHRVVVHTLDGEVLRGTLTDCDLEAAALALDAGTPGGTAVPSTGVKAIFFMLAPGERPPAPQGRRVRVAFRDGRQVAGFSPDYQEGGVGFFMIPADTRTNTGRIWVYQAAVKQVTVS